MDSPAGGIAVLYYNKTSITKRCLSSLLNAGCHPAAVFAFDNASEPAASEEIKKEFPGVNHLRIEKNRGYSGGFNQALQWLFSAGFDSALFLTNDTIIHQGTLEECLSAAGSAGAGIITPCISYMTGDGGIDSIGGFFDRENYTLGHYHRQGLPEFLVPYQDYAPGTALWVSRETFESLGGMDESYFTYWEDTDFCFRAYEKKIKIARSYQVKISHAVGKTCHKKPLYTAYYFQRNRIRFCSRYLDGTRRKTARARILTELETLENKWKAANDTSRLIHLPEIYKELDSL